MNKFVIDTNILLDEPNFLSHFSKCTIILPLDIFPEVDKYKKAPGELGANARAVARELDKYSKTGDATKGVEANTNTLIFYDNAELVAAELLKYNLDPIVDNKIIVIAKINDATVISNDLIVRIKARAIGIMAEEFQVKKELDAVSEIYAGTGQLFVSEESINHLYSHGSLDHENTFVTNQYLKLQSEVNPSQTALAKWDGSTIQKLPNIKSVFGMRPKNMEQHFALDALMDKDIELVTMLGRAGTGKTLLCLIAALELVLERQEYSRIILMRSPIPVGRDIGWLPGDIMSKIMPYFQAYLDNLETIFDSRKEGNTRIDDIVNNMMDMGQLEFVPPTFMRGRSIPNSIIVVDEAQNMSRHEIKTIATRMGEKSKLIVMGDLQQIDAKFDALDNGFTHLIEAFKGEKCSAHITLHKCERSGFADLAAERL